MIEQGNKSDTIEFMRFIAAFSVVCLHTPTIGVGRWGVDIFFIISGIVMMLSTERDGEQFVLKRLIRIVPTYYLFTIGVFLVALASPNLLGNTTANPVHLIKSLLFIPFDKNGSGHYPILFLGWTLNFEMLFYLLFAISMRISYGNRGLIAPVAVILVFFLSRNFPDYPLKAYTNTVILEFMLGTALYLAMFKRKYPLAGAIFLIYLSPLLMGAATLDDRGYKIGLPALLFCSLSLAFLPKVKIPVLFTFLGGASYSLYLTHPYVIQIFDKVTRWFSKSLPLRIFASALSMTLVLALASAIYQFLEKPIRGYLRRKLLRSARKSEPQENPGGETSQLAASPEPAVAEAPP